MKNIMVVDDSQDYFYDIHTVSDEDFSTIFPLPGQNVEFHDDLYKREETDKLKRAFHNMWYARIPNSKARGLHGILFYENWDRKSFYPGKRDISDSPIKIDSIPIQNGKTVIVFDKSPKEPIVACEITVDLFDVVFPRRHQDVEFAEDLAYRVGISESRRLLKSIKEHLIKKDEIKKIDGTIYIGYPDKRDQFTNKVDSEIPRHYPLMD